jgi:hypothetical protein
VNTLQTSFDRPHHQQSLDHDEAAASVQDNNHEHDDANAATAASRHERLLHGGPGGRGNGGRGATIPPSRGLLSVHVVALMMILPNQPTMMMMGWANQSSLYLNWELKVEKLWHMHQYTEDRKINLHLWNLMDMHCFGGIILCSPGLKLEIHLLLHGGV